MNPFDVLGDMTEGDLAVERSIAAAEAADDELLPQDSPHPFVDPGNGPLRCRFCYRSPRHPLHAVTDWPSPTS